jgi:hypothetical protein
VPKLLDDDRIDDDCIDDDRIDDDCIDDQHAIR